MSEKIKELARKNADYWMNHYDRNSLADMELLYKDVEKFANLIIKDCIELCLSESTIEGIAQKCAKKIKEYFEIK